MPPKTVSQDRVERAMASNSSGPGLGKGGVGSGGKKQPPAKETGGFRSRSRDGGKEIFLSSFINYLSQCL